MNIFEFVDSNPIGAFVYTMERIMENEDNDEEEHADAFLSMWPQVKDAIRDQYRKLHVLKLPLYDFHVPAIEGVPQVQLDVEFYNILISMNDCLNNTKHFEELIHFTQDMLVLFDWSDDEDSYDFLRCDIADAYDSMGQYNDRDKLYRSMLAPGKNERIASRYALSLICNHEFDKAEEVLKPYEGSDNELIKDRFKFLKEMKAWR